MGTLLQYLKYFNTSTIVSLIVDAIDAWGKRITPRRGKYAWMKIPFPGERELRRARVLEREN